MTDANKHELLMNNFVPYGDYDVDNYYGVTMMTIKKTGKISIQLQYDYSKRAHNSNSMIVDTSEKALEVLRILLKFAVRDKDIPNEPDLSFI
jgi:hypothetical protein